MSWIKDIVNPNLRLWEEFYRNRWQHDKVVRSTHGVNCTGGCSWNVYVKNGIVTWEMQALDYPKLEPGLPLYEPRGCQRGIVFSWYIYSPLRIKYPYLRGVLMDLWHEARAKHEDAISAWASIVENEEARSRYQTARGKGGFRRASWDECLELIAASMLYTAKKYGPDRVIGFSPIPAMSMLSYAGGSRFLQLFGGVLLSFYDLYADFPPASPETWGEKTDVAESADWFNSKYIVTVGSNLSMTRTPDVHFAVEARGHGAKLVVLSPDLSQVSKFADWWIPVHAGMDGALWMAVNHVILKEFYCDRQVPYFVDYLKRFSDAPFLVELKKEGNTYSPAKFLRANRLTRYRDIENGEWKLLVFDVTKQEPKMPLGAIGFRWQNAKGQWNLQMKDGLDGSEIDPQLSLLGGQDEVVSVQFTDHGSGRVWARGVPIRYIETEGKPRCGYNRFRSAACRIGSFPRVTGRVSRELRKRRERLYTRLAGKIHRREPQHRSATGKGVRNHRGEDKGQVHDYCRIGHKSLVSQQSPLSLGDHNLGRMRLRGGQWWRAEPLHGPGKVNADGILVHSGDGAGLDAPSSTPEWAIVPLRSQRPMAL